MESSAANTNLELTSPKGLGFINAQRLLFRFLETLEHGRLVIQDKQGIFEFGQSSEEAKVCAHITVHNEEAYREIIVNGSVGAGEAYMAGFWSSPDLTHVIQVFVANMELLQSLDKQSSVFGKLASKVLHFMLRRNSREGARKNIHAHYDLSNEFFSLFLDRSMMYSAAIFPTAHADIHEASEYKLWHICQRLNLQPDDHLVEIGTGWGAMAIYAASHYGCKVTTTTISRAQYEYACEAVEKAGVQDKVTVLEKDYRDLEGQYDKLVSIEMIEAVGHNYYQEYFAKCSSLLKPDGLMLIQAITIADQRYERAKKNVDFIQKYIFPGGALPSVSAIANHVADDTDMMVVGLEDITEHYADTLKAWRQRFMNKLPEVNTLGFDETFIRMWEFYLCYCEGGFRERVIGTCQVLMAKPQCKQLPQVA